MSVERVWCRFNKKKRDGTILKLRIQDLPPSRNDEVAELMLRYYVREEPCQKAVDVSRSPDTPQIYTDYMKETFSDPNFSCVICCSDDSDEVTKILGVSAMLLSKEYTWDMDKETNKPTTPEWDKYNAICAELLVHYNPMEDHNLDTFYDDRGLFVVPEVRGLGIAKELLKSRRLICEAQGVAMTGGWMSSLGTQIAAARDGWETVTEISYSSLAERHGVDFSDAPPTMKYMIARASGLEDRDHASTENLNDDTTSE